MECERKWETRTSASTPRIKDVRTPHGHNAKMKVDILRISTKNRRKPIDQKDLSTHSRIKGNHEAGGTGQKGRRRDRNRNKGDPQQKGRIKIRKVE